MGFLAERKIQVRHFGLVPDVLIEDPHHLRLVVQLEKPFECGILLASFPEHKLIFGFVFNISKLFQPALANEALITQSRRVVLLVWAYFIVVGIELIFLGLLLLLGLVLRRTPF